jgi:hypothetical protein
MKILYILIPAFAFTSCFNSIPNNLPDSTRIESWDEYKKQDRYTLNFSNIPKERASGLFRMQSTFLREVNDQGSDRVLHFVVLHKGQTAFYPEAEFFVKTDHEIFRLRADQKELEQYQHSSESTSNILKADSSTVTVIDSYSTTNYIQQRFMYDLSPEMKLAILKSNGLTFRFYSGGLASTFVIRNADLYDLKVLLDTL